MPSSFPYSKFKGLKIDSKKDPTKLVERRIQKRMLEKRNKAILIYILHGLDPWVSARLNSHSND